VNKKKSVLGDYLVHAKGEDGDLNAVRDGVAQILFKLAFRKFLAYSSHRTNL